MVTGCDYCKGCRYSNKDFLEECQKVHGDKYDYSKVVYTQIFDKIEIICPIHGSFIQSAKSHKDGIGCPECSKIKATEKQRQKGETEFKKKLLELFGTDHYLGEFVNNRVKLQFYCEKCGEYYWKSPKYRIHRLSGCQRCSQSKGETEVEIFLRKHDIEYRTQEMFDTCRSKRKLRFDFYLTELNILIEVQGIQHFEPVERFRGQKGFEDRQKRDQIKRDWCKENNVPLIEIRYDENINEVLEDKLLGTLLVLGGRLDILNTFYKDKIEQCFGWDLGQEF